MPRTSNAPFVFLFLVFVVAFASLSVAAQPLAEGMWTKKTASISGSWSIVEEGGSRFLVLSDDFKTKKAPDLKLFLSSRDFSAIDGSNATSQAVFIAKLKSARGGQRYPIPDDIDLNEHSTLLLHCEKEAKVWGGAKIR